VTGETTAGAPVGERGRKRDDQQVEADVPEVVPDVLVPEVRRLLVARDRVVDAVRGQVDALPLRVQNCREPEQGPVPAAGPATPQGTGRSGERRVQPFLTSISVLLKMLFPLDGSVVLPFSITPVRFFQIVLPAIANGPSLSTYTP